MDRIVASRISRRRILGASLAAPAIALVPGGLMRVAAQDKTVVTMVADTAGIGDQSFNDAANAGGTKAAEETGVEWKVIESIDATAYEPNLTAAAEQSELVVATGYLLGLAMEKVVPQFPDNSFIIIDTVVDLPNVRSVTFKEQEPSFLVGVAAGLTTKANKIGIVNGERIPPVIRYEVGFRAGVASVNPDAVVTVTNVDAFDDPVKGKEFALAHLNNGADIIFPIAGQTGIGCYEAIKEVGTLGEDWIISADLPQDHLAPGFELCVSRKQVDGQVYEGVKAFSEGKLEFGAVNLGITNGGGGFEDPNNRVSADATAMVEAYAAMIADGSLVVPSDDDTFGAFVPVPLATPTA